MHNLDAFYQITMKHLLRKFFFWDEPAQGAFLGLNPHKEFVMDINVFLIIVLIVAAIVCGGDKEEQGTEEMMLDIVKDVKVIKAAILICFRRSCLDCGGFCRQI